MKRWRTTPWIFLNYDGNQFDPLLDNMTNQNSVAENLNLISNSYYYQ